MADGVVTDPTRNPTTSFIVRFWYERQEDGEDAVRIQARRVPAGETRYFPSWETLTAYLSGEFDVTDPTLGA